MEVKCKCRICDKEIEFKMWMNAATGNRLCSECLSKYGNKIEVAAIRASGKVIEKIKKRTGGKR